MSAVAIRAIKKYFDKVRAVDGINLEIKDSEFLVILGPSGCGKTALMCLIAGLEKPAAGRFLSAALMLRRCRRANAACQWSSRATRSIRT